MAVRKYMLKVGPFVTGTGSDAKFYNAKKPGQNIVPSDKNLALLHPDKFTLYEDSEDEDEPSKAASKAADKAPKVRSAPLMQRDLESKSVADLQKFAEEEEYDLGGATTKADMIKAILKAQNP